MRARFLSFTLLSCLVANAASADEQGPSELDLFQLEDNLHKSVNVAATQSLKEEEAPGIVTVVTRDDIQSSGARDLIDILMLVPGFSFSLDNEGIVDIGFRGIWAHEGKILILVDGQEMNEGAFQNNELGHHYPVDQIERIEIIRGPGSVLYGGMAELGVINITTRGAKELHGASASLTYGQMAHAVGIFDVNLAAGHEAVGGIQGLDMSFASTMGWGDRSDAKYTDFFGSSYSMGGQSGLHPLFMDMGIRYKDLRTRFIYDGYVMGEKDSGSNISPVVSQLHFTNLTADAQYDIHLGDRVTLTPRFNYKHQYPFQVTDINSPDYYDITVQRMTASLIANAKIIDSLHVLAGLQYIDDRGWLTDRSTIGVGYQAPLNGAGDTTVLYQTVAALAEAEWKSVIGLLTVGGRYEHNQVFGDSFVPRFALTKAIGDFHFKAIFQYSFRPPSIGAIGQEVPGTHLVPERTRDAEIELGYRFGEHMLVTANVFDLHISQPIIYSLVDFADYYQNNPYTGSEGVEVDYRVSYGAFRGDLNYSYYTSWSLIENRDENAVPLYQVPGNDAVALSFPQHKLTANAKFTVWRSLAIAPSLVVISRRYGYLTGDGAGNGILGISPPVALLNVFVSYEDLGIKGLNVGVGCYDILEAHYAFIQAYASGHPPLPGPTREFLAKASMSF